MTCIQEFSDPVQAGIMTGFLREQGIEATLFDEGASAWSAVRTLVPIRLMVPDEQAEEALTLLRELENAPFLDEGQEPTP